MANLTILKISEPVSYTTDKVISYLTGQEGNKILVLGGKSLEPSLLANKTLVSAFQQHGEKSLGLIGADLNIFQFDPEDPETFHINPGPVFSLIKQEIILVFSPFVSGGEGQLTYYQEDKFTEELAAALTPFLSVRLISHEEVEMSGDLG